MKRPPKLPRPPGFKDGAHPGPPSDGGLAAAARVVAAGGRVPKKFAKARPPTAGPTLGAAEARAKVSPARLAAFEVLMAVAALKAHSDEALHGPLTEALSEPDRNLATALVMGVLRWQIALDARIRSLLERPDQRVAEPVLTALRLGALQLVHMDRIPAHAALSESVELCRAAGQPHATGMVNAVLRRIASAQPAGSRVFESTAAFAERLAHPRWIVERWVAHFGREAALKICEADQREPGHGGLFSAGEADLPQIDDGSRLVAEIAAAALPAVDRVAKVWDCCAAPGGKTLVLAHRLRKRADILATDVSVRRLGQMDARLRRFAYAKNIRTAVADSSELAPGEGSFDLVLCDVPCSGTGTMARNPEIRTRLALADLARQADRQRQLLSAGLQRVAPGGRLVYSTCSLEPEENEAVISAVAQGWCRVPLSIDGLTIPLEGLVVNDALRTLPGVHPCDGFFAVVLERKDDVPEGS